MKKTLSQTKVQSLCAIAAGWLLVLGLPLAGQAQTGAYTLNGGSASLSSFITNSSTADQSGVFVYNSGNLTVGTVTITTSGNASDTDKAGRYGVNAGILAGTSSSKGTVTISGSSNRIVTSGSVANGLFATYSGSSIAMLGGSIVASGANAHGVDVTYGGSITLSNVDVTTFGASASAIATDFGGGTVKVTGGTIVASNTAANGHSAGIYSTGTITVNDANVTSMGDCGGVIDGANSIILTNTVLKGALEGFKLWKTAPATGNATVTIKGGSVTASGGNLFYVTGTTGNAAAGTLNVLGGAILSASTGNLVKVDSSSTATFTATGETLAGNLVTDSSSTINASLLGGTTLTGAINTAGTGTENLTIDATSGWNVTANSVLTKLTNAGAIHGPGTVTAGAVILQSGTVDVVLGGTGTLTKTTTGSATLSGANAFTGATTVSNGTLLVDGRLAGGAVSVWGGTLGGRGSIGGTVGIRSGATLSPGSAGIGSLTVSNALTFYSGSTLWLEIDKSRASNDVVRATGLMTMAGSLMVTNLGGVLAGGDSFKLLDAASYSGGFSSVTLPGLAAGLAWDTNTLASSGTISVVSVAPVFNAPILSGNSLIYSGTCGTTNEWYYVLGATNIALPVEQWARISTNRFNPAGRFCFTNLIDPALPQHFTRLELP